MAYYQIQNSQKDKYNQQENDKYKNIDNALQAAVFFDEMKTLLPRQDVKLT